VISGRDIVILSGVEWHELWQGPHELASRLAANGNRVLYVENIGVRAPRWGDRARVLTRLRSWSRGLRQGGMRTVAGGLWVSAPLMLPPFGSRLTRMLNRRVLVPAVARRARRLGLRDPIVWTYLPTDTALDLIACLRSPSSPVVYSCVSDFAERVTRCAALERSERTLLRECDVVFALPALYERCARHSARVLLDEPAVSTELFDPQASPARPPALADVRGPVVGYVGGLQRNLDLALLEALARERPDWTWVFAGPAYLPVERLARMANVRLIGALAHDELPAAIAAFDVCISPLLLDAYTASMVPTKFGEYLAMGKPIVATPIPYALELERAAGGIVRTAGPCAREFADAIERALALAADDLTAQRCRLFAQARAWSQRMEQVSDALAEADRRQLAGERSQAARVGPLR